MKHLGWLVLVVLLTGLRAIHLDADTPADLAPDSRGEYVDEGYKTLGPRNETLYGSLRWNPADDYAYWTESPLSQAAFRLAFRIGEVDLVSARWVAVLAFAVTLATFVWAHQRRDWRYRLLGVLALAVVSPLFFFSRLALLEPLLIVFVFGAVLALGRWPELSSPKAAAVLLGLGVLGAFTVKASALIYVLPMLGGVGLSAWVRGELRRLRLRWLAAAALVCLVLGVPAQYLAGSRELSAPGAFAKAIVSNPLQPHLAFWFCAALIGAALVVYSDRARLGDPYFTALTAATILVPIELAALDYHPLRYYVPVVPIVVALTVEVVARLYSRVPAGSRTLLAWGRIAVVLLAGYGAGKNVQAVSRFLRAPTYELRDLQARMVSVLPPGTILIGDWAPLFALGTDFKSLYANGRFNSTEEWTNLRPDVFLFSEGDESNYIVWELSRRRDVSVEPPIVVGTYAGYEVRAHPLRWHRPTETPDPEP